MPMPFHQAGCKCNLCFVRDHVAGVDPKQAGCETATEKKSYCGACLSCLVLAVALRGATERAFAEVGFTKQDDGKWKLDPKKWIAKPPTTYTKSSFVNKHEPKTAPAADPKLPTV